MTFSIIHCMAQSDRHLHNHKTLHHQRTLLIDSEVPNLTILR